jgi:hypothetical protein
MQFKKLNHRTPTIAQNTMLKLLRGHYKAIITICVFKPDELNSKCIESLSL